MLAFVVTTWLFMIIDKSQRSGRISMAIASIKQSKKIIKIRLDPKSIISIN